MESLEFTGREAPRSIEAERAVIGGMMLSDDAVRDVTEVLSGVEFYEPRHERIFRAILAVRESGVQPDNVTVTKELMRTGDIQKVGPTYVGEVYSSVPTAANARYYAEIVAELALRRGAIAEATRAIQAMYAPDGDAQELLEDVVERLRAVRDRGMAAADRPMVTLGEFLEEADDEPEWVIPNVLARWDRLIVTAGEGGGKSLFLRQMLMRTAAGLHPWRRGVKIQPKRVLLVDVENSRSQIRPWLRRLWKAALEEGADSSTTENFVVEVFEGGLDLHTPGDRSKVLRVVERARPDLIAIGPLYKLASGNPNDEEVARVLMSALESLRVASDGAAMLIEAHAPHQVPGQKRRDLRPIGSSLWLRWPEFGFGLSPVSDKDQMGAEELGVVDWHAWRGARSEREWPDQFMRGATWPWQAADSASVPAPAQDGQETAEAPVPRAAQLTDDWDGIA